MDKTLDLLQKIRSGLETKQDLPHQLQQLASSISHTRENESFLQILSNSSKIWDTISDIVNYAKSPSLQIDEIQARVIRGVVVLSRNLITNNQAFVEDLNIQILQYLQCLAHQDQINITIKLNTLHSSLEYLANFTSIKVEFQSGLLTEVNNAISAFLEIISEDQECISLTFTVFANLIEDDQVTSEALSQAKGKQIMELLLESFESINFQSSDKEELSSNELQIMKICKKLITHESFLKFITKHNEPKVTSKYLKIAQIIITSVSQWDIFNLTVILSWTFEHLQTLSNQLQSYFKLQELDKSDEQSAIIYPQLAILLDIYTHLTIFEHTKKFFASYQGLDLLLLILSTLHTNIKPLKLKDSERKGESYSIPDSHFPGCKSLLIEILSQLTHGDHPTQEAIREKHGLEVILSCTNIDDNEPFIKERAIVCLRLLLLENKGNQEFVAKLEARQVLDKDTVENMGYDVEIKDGKVELKKKEQVVELERKIGEMK